MSEANTLPNYGDIEQALYTIRASTQSPAEMHGLLAAMLCAGVPITPKAWFDSMITFRPDANDAKVKTAQETLLALFTVNQSWFAEHQDDFMMVLPEEDAPMEIRIEALAMWCQGFLTGLHLLEDKLKDQVAEDVAEALEDLTNMACLAYDDEQENDEASQKAYVELTEFARVAVLMVQSHFMQKTHVNQSKEIH